MVVYFYIATNIIYDKIKHVADSAKQVFKSCKEKNLLTDVELSGMINESLEGDEIKMVFEN